MSPSGTLLRRYERSLTRLLAAFDYAQVVYNRRHEGRLSGAPRHVQVMIYGAVADLPVTVAVECRQQHRPVGISCVDYFVAKLEDVGADRGILYSCAGFTGPAVQRAARSHDPAVFAISFGEAGQARAIPIPRQRRPHGEPAPLSMADRIDELAYASFLRYPGACDRRH
ncbi:restriction endonuclease [Catenuloplanes japonicus]|uniref:restriction endonuclease n=1 Tax=Catenuloplanes japonicus TaxID=33876 RepID=UPI0005261C44|nr:restriction endonuclease [Catenuloplanes japonicus]